MQLRPNLPERPGMQEALNDDPMLSDQYRHHEWGQTHCLSSQIRLSQVCNRTKSSCGPIPPCVPRGRETSCPGLPGISAGSPVSQEIPLSLAAGQLVILPKGFQATKDLLSHIPVTNPVTPIRPQHPHTGVLSRGDAGVILQGCSPHPGPG